MNRLILLLVFSIVSAFSFAQLPVQIWVPPRLVISGATDTPIQVQSIRINAELRGRHALTEIDMTFFNPNRRVLEGELQFPLLAGQRIAGFAMDVNGVLREAVPVEKARGQAVFEDIIRNRIDPGLLEVTQGNNFKLRVYPIPAQGVKRVVLRIAETIQSARGNGAFRLPLGFADRIGSLEVDIRVGGNGKPAVRSLAFADLQFAQEQDAWRLRMQRRDAAIDRNGLLEIAFSLSHAPVATTQVFEGRTYFSADVPITARASARAVPNVVGIVWDASGSGETRDHGREFALLDAYFRTMRNGDVWLTRIRDVAEPAVAFRIIDGNWSALRKALTETAYDGATNLGAFVPMAGVKEYLLFSDGLANYGDAPFAKSNVPLYAINAAIKSDATFLRHVADRSGGRFIDLTSVAAAEGARVLLTRATRVTDVVSNGGSQIVMSSPFPQGGRVLIAGVLNDADADLRITLDQPGMKSQIIDVPVTSRTSKSAFAAGQWAQLRVAELEGEYTQNRAEIRRLGQRFKLVTRETSLIVLDRVEDYARFEIAPPAELRADYERVTGNIAQLKRAERKSHLDNIVRLFEEKTRWWNRDFPKDSPAKKEAKIALMDRVANAVGASGAVVPRVAEESRRERDVTTTAGQRGASDARALNSPAAAAPPALAKMSAPSVASASPSSPTVSAASSATTATIRLQKWQPDATYVPRIRDAAPAERYRIYLDEKPSHANSTAFFLDVADVFIDHGNAELGARILSNLAEMDLENRHILRILGYRLMQAKLPAVAIPVLRKVLALSPEEPQSYRDLGLAYAGDGQRQKAIDALYEVVIRPWHGRFPEVELITLAEMNSIIATSPTPLDLSKIEPRLLKNLPLDLRAVLTWDADNTDIDLWVTDPNGEKAYYGNRLTFQGGRMSQDFTGGYGPEEFSLKQAKPGKYKVEANYFGDRRQNVTGATTLSMRLTTHFGTTEQQDQIVTLRLKDRQEVAFVGEFEIK